MSSMNRQFQTLKNLFRKIYSIFHRIFDDLGIFNYAMQSERFETPSLLSDSYFIGLSSSLIEFSHRLIVAPPCTD